MSSSISSWLRATLIAPAAVAAAAGCARPGVAARAEPIAPRGGLVTLRDATATYARAGLLASREPLPFTGWVRFLAGTSSDGALALVALSFPARAFTFVREREGYRARYDVLLEFRRGSEAPRRAEAGESVRVATMRETTRDEESVIHQQYVELPAGTYTLLVAVRDSVGSRETTASLRVTVPRFAGGGVAAPVPVYQARPRRALSARPDLVANARATVVFARDSVAHFYLERYGATRAASLRLRASSDSARQMYEVTLPPASDSAGPVAGEVVTLPVPRLGLGPTRLEVLVGDSIVARTTTSTFFVSLGEGLVVGSFEEVVDHLRWFTTPERLRALEEAAPERRADAWQRFLRETDTAPDTPELESLREYLARLEAANARFREGQMPGWLTDRGMVFAALGEPDRVSEPTGPAVALRSQSWEYDELRARLVFVDRGGLGEWRLTPASEAEFRELASRRRMP